MGPVVFPPGHPDPDGSAFLLSDLDGRPETYRAWAAGYYERDVGLEAVEHVYLHRPLTAEVVARTQPVGVPGRVACRCRGDWVSGVA